MSIDQPTLDDFDGPQQPETVSDRGAAYRPDFDNKSVQEGRAPENSCLNCGATIESGIARVIGDNDGNVPACSEPECRDDVLDDNSLSRDEYFHTTRLVRALRSGENGSGASPARGGHE